MSVVPFVFIKYGDRIRAGSRFCQELKERKREAAEAQMKSSRDRDVGAVVSTPIIRLEEEFLANDTEMVPMVQQDLPVEVSV